MSSKWKAISTEVDSPRAWPMGLSGWYRYGMKSAVLGEPIGLKRLRELRSSGGATRLHAAGQFAKAIAELVPNDATVCFMPSSRLTMASSDPRTIAHAVLNQLGNARPDVRVVDPLMRSAPVPSVRETRLHDIEVLRSTLDPNESCELPAGQLFVLDDMVATGATFAAFVAALHDRWPRAEPVLLAYVYSDKSGSRI